MDLSRIELLLERYWNCVTTVEEEEELRLYFNSNQVPENLREAANLFKYYEMQREATLDSKFENEVLQKIGEQKSAKVVNMNHYFKNYMRVAAAVLVVAVASLVFRMEYFDGEKPKLLLVEDTFQTPKKLMKKRKKLLC